MKRLIPILLLVAATAYSQEFSRGGWASVGAVKGSNYAYAICPGPVTSLSYWCQQTNCSLTLWWPTQMLWVTATVAAAQPYVTVTNLVGITEGAGLIVYSKSNRVYQFFLNIEDTDGVCLISNKADGGDYATLAAPIRSNDMVFVCKPVQLVAPGALPRTSLPVTQNGAPLAVGPNGWPIAYELFLGSGSSGDSMYLNAFGLP